MGWFDSQIQERRACDDALLADAVAGLSEALAGDGSAPAAARRSLPQRALSHRDVYRFLIGAVSRRDWRRILLAALGASLAGAAVPAATSYAFAEVIPLGATGTGLLAPLLALLLSAGLAQVAVGAMRSLIVGRVIEEASAELITALMERALELPARFFSRTSSGDVASRLLSVRSMVELLGDALFSTGLTAVFSLVYVVQIAVMWPEFAGIAFSIIVLRFAACAVVAYRKSRVLTARLMWRARRSGREVSLVNGVQKIRLSGAGTRAFARWAGLYRGEVASTYGDYLDAALLSVLSVAGLLGLYAFAAVRAVPVASFMGFAAAYGMVSVALDNLAYAACAGMTARPFLDLIDPFLAAVPETGRRGQEVERLMGRIELDHVTFSYGEDRPPVIKDLSLKIRPGQYVGIVGRTGCGKSTLMRLLLGFEEPQSGAVYYDGRDLNTLDVRSLRRHMGTVTQDGKLFAGSLSENILVSAPHLGAEDAWRAAELAGIADDIRAMPMGMNTLVGEGASGLSGGQRQRIMIARAIAANPCVLLFDEATSALDNVTQAHVSRALAGLNCTRIAIAHRLSTVRDCDRILVLDGGHIAEEGTFDELMARDGLFAELARRQQT